MLLKHRMIFGRTLYDFLLVAAADYKISMPVVRIVTRRAESDGIEVHHRANQWILELNRSSDIAIEIFNNGQAELTYEEFVDYVGRTGFWFENGLAVSGGRQV